MRKIPLRALALTVALCVFLLPAAALAGEKNSFTLTLSDFSRAES